MRKCLILSVAWLLASTVSSMAQQTLLTSNGHIIEARPAAGLSCAQISERLAAIDETGYRVGGPVPASDNDAPIYEYELKLSVEFFWRCATRVDGEAQNDAFKSGFSDAKTK